MKKLNQKGFSIVEVLVVAVVVVLACGIGWFVWQRQNDKSPGNSTNQTQAQETEQKLPTQKITLADDTVSFEAPEAWAQGNVGCKQGAPIFGNEKVLDSVELLPVKKSEDSKEPSFSVDVCVFDNPQDQTPQEWANSTDGGASIGYPSENDITSEEPINGNLAYYLKFTRQEHGGIEDVYYIISAQGKIVYVSARTRYDFTGSEYSGEEYKPYGGKTYDFQEYESKVKDIANSVVIK